MPLSKKDVERFRKILNEKRATLVDAAVQTLREDMKLESDDLADEMDLASSEYLQSFTLRLRGREKFLLDKIDLALQRIDSDLFGICESCEEEIALKRLEARPETTLCVTCKEEQERGEQAYG